MTTNKYKLFRKGNIPIDIDRHISSRKHFVIFGLPGCGRNTFLNELWKESRQNISILITGNELSRFARNNSNNIFASCNKGGILSKISKYRELKVTL